jgi:hypothetical protein
LGRPRRKAADDLDVGIAEVRRVLAEAPRSAELMVRLPDEVMRSISVVRIGLVIEAS